MTAAKKPTKTSALPSHSGAMTAYHIESTPSGNGSNKHVAVFQYPDGVRRFDGYNWTFQPASSKRQ
jgi:hypothetical protein